MNKNSNRPPIQFTKLTPDDVVKHEDSYILLLLGEDRTLEKKGEELAKAKRMFCEAFE